MATSEYSRGCAIAPLVTKARHRSRLSSAKTSRRTFSEMIDPLAFHFITLRRRPYGGSHPCRRGDRRCRGSDDHVAGSPLPGRLRHGQISAGQLRDKGVPLTSSRALTAAREIGWRIATRLAAFGYHNRNPLLDVLYYYATSPLELALDVEVLAVATSGGPDSAGLMSREVHRGADPAGYLINVVRGSIVDEEVLVDLPTGSPVPDWIKGVRGPIHRAGSG